MLEIVSLTIRLPGGATLIDGLSLAVAAGQVTTVMGPSGCGKSTLLAAVAGTIDPVFDLAGDIRLDGNTLLGLPPQDRHMGMLFQDALLFPHLSLGENLAFGLRDGQPRGERRARVDAALKEAELEGLFDQDPDTLSGGQRARAALMRTLLAEPAALLLDEPFSRLDQQLRKRLRQFVFDHAAQRNLPMLLVTHDPADAEAAGGPVITL